MRCEFRPATDEEYQQDYLRRRAALDRAIEDGLLSKAQIQIREEALYNFQGYPRPVERHRTRARLSRPRLRISRLAGGRRT